MLRNSYTFRTACVFRKGLEGLNIIGKKKMDQIPVIDCKAQVLLIVWVWALRVAHELNQSWFFCGIGQIEVFWVVLI